LERRQLGAIPPDRKLAGTNRGHATTYVELGSRPYHLGNAGMSPLRGAGFDELGTGSLWSRPPLGREDELSACTCHRGRGEAQRNRSRVTLLGRHEPAARTDTSVPGCYISREALHAGSRLPPPLPAYCRGDGLPAARSRNCRPASCHRGSHAAGARARPAAICQSSPATDSLAATCCPGSFAGFSVSRPPLLRRHQRLPVG
jgi:hypothetical protein